ncbi:MAG: hypothetical protein ACXU9K_06745 [Thermodesulfobacteriota bacterium]
MATELKLKSRENDSERGISNPPPVERERAPVLMVEVARSCPAQAGVHTKVIAMINATIKKALGVTIEELLIVKIVRYWISIVKNMSQIFVRSPPSFSH